MNKTQSDLLKVCLIKGIKANYPKVREYAYNFRKYDNMTMREIDEVVKKLKELRPAWYPTVIA